MNLCRMSGLRMCSRQWIEMIDVRICYFTGGLEVSLAVDGHDVATVFCHYARCVCFILSRKSPVLG